MYKGLKFDLRIYVLIAGCNPLRIFLFKDGLVRFATESYQKVTEGNKEEVYMHLTNYAINKLNPKFKDEGLSDDEDDDQPCHKRSIIDFFNELRAEGHNMDQTWDKIGDIIVKTVCSIQPILKHNYKTCHADDPYNQTCFEILGFDILLNEKLRPYLIEVNHSPSFRTGSMIDERVKTNLIRDTLRILNLSKEMKKKLVQMRRKQKDTKRNTGRNLKLNEGKVKKECLRHRDEYMIMNKGGFNRIYPPEKPNSMREKKYQQILEEAEGIYHRFTGSGKDLRYKNFGRIMRTMVKSSNMSTKNLKNNNPRKSYLRKMKENVGLTLHRATKSQFIGQRKKFLKSKLVTRKEQIEKMKLDLTRRWAREEKEIKEKEVKRASSRRSVYSRKSHRRSRSRKSIDVTMKLNLDALEEFKFENFFHSCNQRSK